MASRSKAGAKKLYVVLTEDTAFYMNDLMTLDEAKKQALEWIAEDSENAPVYLLEAKSVLTMKKELVWSDPKTEGK